MRRKFYIQFLNEIKQKEILYSSKFFSQKYHFEKKDAWKVISRKLKKDERFLRDKWKNIRSHYLLSFQTNKDYYLAPYLDFLLPHLRLAQRRMQYPSNNFLEFFKHFIEEEFPEFYDLTNRERRNVYKKVHDVLKNIIDRPMELAPQEQQEEQENNNSNNSDLSFERDADDYPTSEEDWNIFI